MFFLGMHAYSSNFVQACMLLIIEDKLGLLPNIYLIIVWHKFYALWYLDFLFPPDSTPFDEEIFCKVLYLCHEHKKMCFYFVDDGYLALA